MMLELEDIVANPELAKSVIDHLSKKTRTLQETLDSYKLRLDGAPDVKPVIARDSQSQGSKLKSSSYQEAPALNRHLLSATIDTPLKRLQQHLTTHPTSSTGAAVQPVPLPSNGKLKIKHIRKKCLTPCKLFMTDEGSIVRPIVNTGHIVLLAPTRRPIHGNETKECQLDSAPFAVGMTRDIVYTKGLGPSQQRSYTGTYEVLFIETLHAKDAVSLLPPVTNALSEQMARIYTGHNLRGRMCALLDDGTVRLQAIALSCAGMNKALVARIRRSTPAKKSEIEKVQKVEQTMSDFAVSARTQRYRARELRKTNLVGKAKLMREERLAKAARLARAS